MRTDNNLYVNYNPDILETIANLSNDEVFTPPKLANDILDLLPKEIWKDSKITFLDPAVKTGVFLREIASRLIDGLAEEIPDLQERVNHILTKQVFGIGITELTTLMARRTLYCSMYANGDKSICTEFDNPEGNIVFPQTEHTFNERGKCEHCGANEENYSRGADMENYAYSFIHDNMKEVFGNMKFDVIIGNPPYQMSVGSSNAGRDGASAKAIYHLFVDKAIELNPKYISIIMPSRWMGRSAKGIPKEWIDNIISDKRIREMHDFINSEDCFENVMIRGGVNYFLWDRNYTGKCGFYQHSENKEVLYNKDYLNSKNSGILIRDINALSIVDNVCEVEGLYLEDSSNNFSSMVSPKGLFISELVDQKLAGSWKGFSLVKSDTHDIKYYTSSYLNGVDVGWIKKSDILRNTETIKLHKIYINAAGDNEKFGRVIATPQYSEPNSICSGTYLVIGYDSITHNLTEQECFNIISYIQTKFFRFLVDVKKSSQHCSRSAYQFVPLQDWSKPWTDAELYAKYNLSEEEIAYIEDNIAPMGGQEDSDDLEVDEEYLDDLEGFDDEIEE